MSDDGQSANDTNDDLIDYGRPWLGYWSGSDKAMVEREAVRTVLSDMGFRVENLSSRGKDEDPPDCEANIEGHWCGIEVTELVHQPMLERSLKARKQRKNGLEPARAEAYFDYSRESFLDAIQLRIDDKDKREKVKGGYMLVIVTDEFFLYEEAVGTFLEGAMFRASFIDDAFLGLSYHPSVEPEEGRCPAFRLPLTPRT